MRSIGQAPRRQTTASRSGKLITRGEGVCGEGVCGEGGCGEGGCGESGCGEGGCGEGGCGEGGSGSCKLERKSVKY